VGIDGGRLTRVTAASCATTTIRHSLSKRSGSSPPLGRGWKLIDINITNLLCCKFTYGLLGTSAIDATASHTKERLATTHGQYAQHSLRNDADAT